MKTKNVKLNFEQKKDWCLTILEFFLDKKINFSLITQMKNVVNDSYNNNNKRGLDYCFKDINEMSKGLLQSDQDELELLLNNRFRKNIQDLDNEDIINVKGIVKSERIANEKDYRLILKAIDNKNIFSACEINAINKLLIDFDKRKL